MNIKLLNEHHLEFLSLKEGCTASYESTLVKMPHCWKSHVVLGDVVEVVGSNLVRGKIFTASIGSVDSLYPSVDSLYPSVYIYIFLCNTGPDSLKIHKATKAAFSVGQSSARQRNAI